MPIGDSERQKRAVEQLADEVRAPTLHGVIEHDRTSVFTGTGGPVVARVRLLLTPRLTTHRARIDSTPLAMICVSGTGVAVRRGASTRRDHHRAHSRSRTAFRVGRRRDPVDRADLGLPSPSTSRASRRARNPRPSPSRAASRRRVAASPSRRSSPVRRQTDDTTRPLMSSVEPRRLGHLAHPVIAGRRAPATVAGGHPRGRAPRRRLRIATWVTPFVFELRDQSFPSRSRTDTTRARDSPRAQTMPPGVATIGTSSSVPNPSPENLISDGSRGT